MSSEYIRKREELKSLRCEMCYGLGKCDDADAGDMSFNSWECPKCSGEGMIDTTKSKVVDINYNSFTNRILRRAKSLKW